MNVKKKNPSSLKIGKYYIMYIMLRIPQVTSLQAVIEKVMRIVGSLQVFIFF